MRRLVVTENITVDGVIDASEGWFAPAGDEEVDQSDLNAALREQAEAADALLLGRVTFEEFRGYGPLQTDDETGVTEYLNNVSKYVASSTMKDPEWERSSVLSGDLEHNVRELKSKAGKDIVATGSITLVHELIPLGLVDEYRLFVYPVVLGRGARLFEDMTNVPKLKLARSRPFRSGVVLTSYSTDGLAGCTANPSGGWVAQQARQFVWTLPQRSTPAGFLIRDRDSKFTRDFESVFRSEGIEILRTPVRAPTANAIAERFVRTARSECLDWLLILNRPHLERVLRVFVHHYNSHRPHRSLDLTPPNPAPPTLQLVAASRSADVLRRDRLGGLIHEYRLAA